MKLLKVALLQMAPEGNDQAANQSKGEKFCRVAAGMDADIALFPEMWNVGYMSYDAEKEGEREKWQQQAIRADGPFVEHFRALAQELEMAIAITYMEAQENRAPRNTVSLIDRSGEIVMTYAKVHTCDFGAMEAACSPGDDFFVCELATKCGAVKIGAMICYDREAPESARILMLKGAELVLVPNACGFEECRTMQLKTRAYENAMGVAMANYAAPKNNGRSVAFDADARLVVQAGEQEGVFPAVFDLDKIREYREKTIWGNAFRRPHRYGLLASRDVSEPFKRKNAFGEAFEREKR